ncbi:MAG TPA: CopG family transcriptional regulator [Clostridiales bacterium]|jgi:putative iron-only hydrogenase system regulator|nr:CopG family transcriptional regulator [Clostridiales bacterium]
MQSRVAIMAIIVENTQAATPINALLHEYGQYIIGRMGLPYARRNISLISVAIDAPQDVISALTGKIGNIPQVSVKTVYSKLE